MTNKAKFVLSTLSIPIPQLISDRIIATSNNSYGGYGYIVYSRYSIYFALMLLLMALYYLLMHFLEKYKEIKG